MNHGLLVVGAGQAAVQLAVSMREFGYTEPITLIGDEPHLPYQRPPLSKGLLLGTATVESLSLRSASFYEDRIIDVLHGERVVGVERDAQGGVATTASGQALPFDLLALAVGAQVRRLLIPGSELSGVMYLRDVSDALALAERVRDARNVVVVGGGFIGLEVAAAVRASGATVTVVEAGPRLMARAVHEDMSNYFTDAHRATGTTVLLDVGVREIHGSTDRVRSVELTDGRVVPADLVVVGVGVDPRTDLAESMGLTCNGGIVVDEFSLTSDGVTVAAGDCASLPVPRDGGAGRCRIESVDNAISHARNAARTLMGEPQPYRLTPWFWSNQGDLKLQLVGEYCGDDVVAVYRKDSARPGFSILFFQGERFVGAQCVNRPADFVACRALLADKSILPIEQVPDTTVPLKKMAVATPPMQVV